jgi:WD40 repeat protein/hemolysin type calcium-binding protein
MRRAAIVLVAMVAAFFSASALTLVEPWAQTTGATAANGKIAFHSYEGGDADIYAMYPDGTGKINLTDEAPDAYSGADVEPAFSPDGTRIAFQSDRSGDYTDDPNWPEAIFDVWVVNADGSGQPRRLTTAEGQAPAWSPDGQQIAYSSSRDGNYEIWVENVDDTGTPRQITHTENTQDGWILNTSPSWSVDGKIAYVSTKDNLRTSQRDIYVANADGTGEPTRLTNTPTSNNWAPEWSPDGKRIAFWRVQYPETCGPCDREVYVMEAVDSDGDGNGENQTNLTNDPAVDYQPDWSPDGTQISFVSNREDGEYNLWTVPAPQPASSSTPGVALLGAFTTDAAFAEEATSGPTPVANSSGASSSDWGPSTAPVDTGGTTCTIKGTSGANTLTGTPGADTICALGGNDTVSGAGGEDVIKGGAGEDTLKGQGGNDQLIGNAGSDGMLGGNGDDTVNSRDSVSGNDALTGGTHFEGDMKVIDATEKSVVGFP